MSSRKPSSPARSQGARTPRRLSTRSTRSLGSPARSGRLSNFVEQFKDQNMESFTLSPQQNSVLSDNTQIEKLQRKSWWKILGDNSQQVLKEAMSDNRPVDNEDDAEDLGVEILSQEKKNFTLDLPDSSGSESIGSIVIPQRKLFTHKENVPAKTQFGKLLGPRESVAKLQKTNIEIHENVAPKKLFGEAAPRKTIFPNVLSTSTNKNEADDPVAPKKIFGEASRKSIFPTNLVQPRTSEKGNESVSPKALEKSGSKKNLLQRNPQAKIAFPAALLNISPNKTSGNKTLGTEVKGQACSLFGNKGGKRKNMFAAFIVADAEEEVPEIEPPQVFGFSKKAEMRRRGSSTSYIEDEDWQLLPSSTMLEGSPAPLKKPKLSHIAPSAHSVHEKSRRENYTVMNKSKDTEAAPANTSRNLSQKDITAKEDAQENNDKMVQDEADNDNNSAIAVADENEESAEAEEGQKDPEDGQVEGEEENQEETKDDQDEVEEETEDQDNESEQEEVEIEQAEQISQEQSDVAESSRAKDNEEIKQNNENPEDKAYDEVMEQVAEMHREERKSLDYEAKLNKSAKEIQKVMEMTKRLEQSDASIYDNVTGSVLKDQDESQEEIDEENITNKSAGNINELLAANQSEEGMKEIENDSVLQDVEDDAIELTYEEDQSEQNEENDDKPKEVEESMEQDEEEERHNKTDKQEEADEIEVSQQEIVAELSQKDESEQEVDENEDEIEEDAETSQQDIDNEAEISQEQILVLQEDENDEEQEEEDENEVEVSQEDEVVVDEEDNEVEQDSTIEQDNEVDVQDDEVEPDEGVVAEEGEEAEEGVETEEEVEPDEDEIEQNEDEAEQNEEEVEASEQEVEASEQEVEVSEQEIEEENESDQESEPVVESEQEGEASEQEVEEEVESDREAEEEVESEDEVESDREAEQEVEESEQEQDQSVENKEIEESQEINDEIENNENEASENEIQESPNVSHDTTGRHRKVKSPEAILQNTTNRRDSFEARRITSLRKTKSMIQPNIQPSPRISTGTNSSAEGSGWDSHRVTKKTIRQTFGKGYTPRKSLRALVMEKSAHRQTMVRDTRETMGESINFPQANSTEMGNSVQLEVEEESDHEVSRRTRQTTLEMYLQKVKKDTLERRKQTELTVHNNLKAPARDLLNLYNINPKCVVRKQKPKTQPKVKKIKPSAVSLGEIPEELLRDLKAQPPKRFAGSNASWITKRLYKFLEAKLEPQYDYEARLRAEELVKTIYDFTKFIRRHDVVPRGAIHELKQEMAELRVTLTHADFYEFFHEFMPREIRLKVVPDIYNKLRLPRDGVFSQILRDANVRE